MPLVISPALTQTANGQDLYVPNAGTNDQPIIVGNVTLDGNLVVTGGERVDGPLLALGNIQTASITPVSTSAPLSFPGANGVAVTGNLTTSSLTVAPKFGTSGDPIVLTVNGSTDGKAGVEVGGATTGVVRVSFTNIAVDLPAFTIAIKADKFTAGKSMLLTNFGWGPAVYVCSIGSFVVSYPDTTYSPTIVLSNAPVSAGGSILFDFGFLIV